MKRFLGVAAAVALVLWLSSCARSKEEPLQRSIINLKVPEEPKEEILPPGVITKEEYNKIEIGITYEDIKVIINGECEGKETVGYGSIGAYTCEGEKGGSASFTFENGTLKSKSENNLL